MMTNSGLGTLLASGGCWRAVGRLLAGSEWWKDWLLVSGVSPGSLSLSDAAIVMWRGDLEALLVSGGCWQAVGRLLAASERWRIWPLVSGVSLGSLSLSNAAIVRWRGDLEALLVEDPPILVVPSLPEPAPLVRPSSPLTSRSVWLPAGLGPSTSPAGSRRCYRAASCWDVSPRLLSPPRLAELLHSRGEWVPMMACRHQPGSTLLVPEGGLLR